MNASEYENPWDSCADAATALIQEEYGINRRDSLTRVRFLQERIVSENPMLPNLMVMAMVNALYKTNDESEIPTSGAV